MTENSNSNLIEDVIKSRLSHPFIGTLITSFTITNYDILLILFTHISSKEIYPALINFKCSLNMNSYRLCYPIFSTITIPFFLEPIINMFHQKTLAIGRRWTKNWVQREEIRVIKDDYERVKKLLELKDQDLNRMKTTLISKWEKVLGLLIKSYNVGAFIFEDSFCYIFHSKVNLNIGELVYYSSEDKKIYPYIDKKPFLGKVKESLGNNFYLVYYDRHFKSELKEVSETQTKYDLIYYSHKYQKFVPHLETGESYPDSFISAKWSGDNYVIQNLILLDKDFKKRYLNDLPDYLAPDQLGNDISRNLILVDFWIFIKRKISNLRIWFSEKFFNGKNVENLSNEES